MRRVISVGQRKGGVGKTTIAVCVAAEFASRGYEVALVDADPQKSACAWAQPGNLAFPVYEVPLADQSVTSWAQIVRTIPERAIIIDSAPNDRSLGATIALSDVLLIPCTPSGIDLDSTERTIEIVKAVQARRRTGPYSVLVPNRVNARTLEGQQLIGELKAFGIPIGPPIGHRAAFVRAFTDGIAVNDMKLAQSARQEIGGLCDFIERALRNGVTGSVGQF